MPEKKDESLNLGYVIDNSLQQLAKLGFLAFIIAWSFTRKHHLSDLVRSQLTFLLNFHMDVNLVEYYAPHATPLLAHQANQSVITPLYCYFQPPHEVGHRDPYQH